METLAEMVGEGVRFSALSLHWMKITFGLKPARIESASGSGGGHGQGG